MASEDEKSKKNEKEIDIEELQNLFLEDDLEIGDDLELDNGLEFDDDFVTEDDFLTEGGIVIEDIPPAELNKAKLKYENVQNKGFKLTNKSTLNANKPFAELLGKELLLTLEADQLNILGQTFRPVFCGKLVEVTNGFITLYPVIIKMPNAPYFQNSFPLSFPIHTIATFVPFKCATKFPIN